MSLDRMAEQLLGSPQRLLRLAQVKSFTAGTVGPPVVQPTVNLQLAGALNEDGSPAITEGVHYLDPYGPSVGDWVWVLVLEPDWLVLGKQATA